MSGNEDPAILKRVVLLTLKEKHEAKSKELAALMQDAKVKAYLELVAGVGLLERAIVDAELALAHASVGFKPQAVMPTTLAKRLRGRMAAYALHKTGGSLLAKLLDGRHVYQIPYAEMLREFRGQAKVHSSRVFRWLYKQYGLSVSTADAYLQYAVQQRTAVRVPGHKAQYEFPSQYDARVEIDESQIPKPDPEEIRRADPMR